MKKQKSTLRYKHHDKTLASCYNYCYNYYILKEIFKEFNTQSGHSGNWF